VIFVVKIIQRTDKTEIKEACLGEYPNHAKDIVNKTLTNVRHSNLYLSLLLMENMKNYFYSAWVIFFSSLL